MMWKFNEFGDNIALIDENDNKISFGELYNIGNDIIKVMNRRSLVFLLCRNEIGSVAAYTAFINAGIVPLLLSANIDMQLLGSLLEKYKPEYICIPEELETGFTQFHKEWTKYQYSILKTYYDTSYELNDKLALLLTTSGTTGSPKLVRQSYKNIKSNAKSIVQYLKLDANEKPITTLPMNYTYGLSIINSHFMVGATLVLTEKSIVQKEFWLCLNKNKCTSFAGVPYTYEILDKMNFYRMDMPSVKTMTQAGGRLSPELHKKIAKYASDVGKEFIVMYGQCEATARMSYLPSEKSLEKYGSVGIAIPGGQFEIVDENGEIIEKEEVAGELLYRGENVTLGYAEKGEDLVKGDERNGKLLTGDLAKRDKDGYYYIVGRKKRFLKIYGNRVNLDEIDKLIKEKFNFIECASVGKDDNLVVFITDESVIGDVRKYISEITKLNVAAFHVRSIETIPKNEAGKVTYSELTNYIEGK